MFRILESPTARWLAFFVALSVGLWGCRTATKKSHNILIISVDTLRADHLGCYGYKGVVTPNLDALASEGVLFERAIAQVPLTWPSHAAIFTGTYPFHNGVQDFTGQSLPENFRTLAETLKAHGYATGAVVSSFVLDRSWGLARGFDEYYDAFAGQDFLHKDVGLVERGAEQSVDHALGWLEGHANQPFFLWLHLYDPHSPYDPPEPFRSRYKEQPYDGEIAYVDSQLSRVFDWLKRSPSHLFDDTVIVFLSDHGESLGEHGEKEHGFFVYNATVHVPLILKAARDSRFSLRRVATPVETIQVAPTVLELAGIQDPIQKQFEAGSLSALIKGSNDAAAQAAAYSETYYTSSSFGWSPLRTIQTARYQYVEAPTPELYDLQSDPEEKVNLFRKNPGEATRLRTQLNQLIARYRPSATEQRGSGPDQEALEKLRSLGYVAYRAPVAAGAGSKLADPKDKLRVYQDVLRATDLMHLGEFTLARVVLRKVQAAEPKLYLIPFLLGEAASREAHWSEAEKEFRRAVQLNPGFDQAMMGLGRALGLQGKTAPAKELLDKVLATNPNNFRAWFVFAQVLAKEDMPASKAALEKVISIQPNFALAYRDLGLLAMRQENHAKAAEHLSQAVQMGLTDAATYNYLGICYSRTDRLEQAVATYQRALAADPKYAQAHLNLGFAYERLNQPTPAKREYQEACRLDDRLCKLISGR
jgi:choline-sulfatase